MQIRREWLGLLLVLAGLLRAGFLVAHEPVIGYANHYDMVRTSACLGLYPEGVDAGAGTPQAPIARYKAGGARTGLCYFATEVGIDAAVIAVARLVDKESRTIPLQWIGAAKLALLGLTALAIALVLHREPGAGLVHGVIFLAVMSDPMTTLWLNSLYTEFGAIWGLYAMIGAACALAQTERGRHASWTVLAIGIFALALSREQYALLPPAIVLAAAPWLWDRSGEMTVAIFLVSVAACLASNAVPRPGVVTHVNRVDTYLAVVVPASARPERALMVLGLPEHCKLMIGTSWYLQRGENLQQECPEVFRLSSVAFLRFAEDEPEALARAVARVLPAMQALAPGYLGTMEGAKLAMPSELPPLAFSPLDAMAMRMPGRIFVLLVMVAILAAPAAALAALAWARPARGRPCTALLLFMLLGGTVLFGVLTTVFGDGMSEAGRHFLPSALALYAFYIAALMGIPTLASRWGEAPRARALEMAGGAVFVVVLWFACSRSLAWAQSQPLGIGTLDEPAGREVKATGLALRGWALDPFGVESVQVELGKLKREAQIDLPSAKLHRHLPGYRDSPRGDFALDLTADDLARAGAPQPLELSVRVKGQGGAITEIDRRRLEFKP